MFAKFFAKRLRRARIANMEAVVAEARAATAEARAAGAGALSAQTRRKVDRFVERNAFAFPARASPEARRKTVLEDIASGNRYAAVQFMVDPMKQNIAERLQIEYLRMHGVSVAKPPRTMYIDRGKVVEKPVSSRRRQTKSVDGVSEDGKTLYFFKYTAEAGGAQDNQFNDVKKTISAARALPDGYLVILVCDGAYYSKQKLMELAELAGAPSAGARIEVAQTDGLACPAKKKALGQFFSTDAPRIFRGLEPAIAAGAAAAARVVEPFAGDGDLVRFVRGLAAADTRVLEFDVDPRRSETVRRDTLRDPPTAEYEDAFVITNPPFLARNKAADKDIFDTIGENDLFRCFLRTLVSADAAGGAVILPVNFLSSVTPRDAALRRDFVCRYAIEAANVFETPVFEDTAYDVMALVFRRQPAGGVHCAFPARFEDGSEISVSLGPETQYAVCREPWAQARARARRVSRALPGGDPGAASRIRLRLVDAGRAGPKIGAEVIADSEDLAALLEEVKISDRTFAHVVVDPPIDAAAQRALAAAFNAEIARTRARYRGLCFPNFRDGGRKRLPFAWAFRLLDSLLAGAAEAAAQ